MRRGDVIGVARKAVTDHLGIDFRAARLGMLIFLEHDDARALAHDEAVAVLVIGAAGAGRIVAEAGGQRPRLAEAGNADRADRAFRAARQHHVGIVHRDHPRRVADRMRAGRACGHDRVIRPHQPVFDRNLTRNQVDEASVDEMGGNPFRPLFGEYQRFAFDSRQPADPRTDRTARAKTLRLAHIGQPGVFERLSGGIDAIDDERIDLALDLVIDALARIEAVFVIGRLYFAGIIGVEIARIEMGDRRRARFARNDVLPGGFDIGPQRSDEAQTGHDYAAHKHSLNISIVRPTGRAVVIGLAMPVFGPATKPHSAKRPPVPSASRRTGGRLKHIRPPLRGGLCANARQA